MLVAIVFAIGRRARLEADQALNLSRPRLLKAIATFRSKYVRASSRYRLSDRMGSFSEKSLPTSAPNLALSRGATSERANRCANCTLRTSFDAGVTPVIASAPALVNNSSTRVLTQSWLFIKYPSCRKK
jgi:hypothetical protein